MSPRADLLHLSPEALTQATNAGLVKRALRELAAGYRPRLVLGADGLLEAAFDDQVRCRADPAGPVHLRRGRRVPAPGDRGAVLS